MTTDLTRRALLRTGVRGLSVAALAQLPASFLLADADARDQVVPFIDPQPADPKRPMLQWQDLQDWITPSSSFFSVGHYGTQKLSAEAYRLKIEGLVENPLELTLDQIMARPKRDHIATLECSGNGASATFMGAIGNAKWTGTPLAPLLKEAGLKPEAIEAAFWGADTGKEKIRNAEYEQNFARALSIADATREDILLAWAMNDQPLAPGHGFPIRLIVPGWYGIAWVKWLTRIELRDRRLMNRFMARDYVTIRGQRHGDRIEWKETSVGPLNIKSLVARVTRRPDNSLHITGAAWAQDPIKSVELKIDDGPWTPVELDDHDHAPHAWTFWSHDWKNPTPGEHTLVSRATDAQGHVQPAADDDAIKLKKTYWEANQQYPRRIKV
jgi:DMSO/TMAO reductase YedYZ molybdopterin-dependent catalytic subunit